MSYFDRERFQAALTAALHPYSLREASEHTGVSPATLSRLERGEGVPDVDTLFRLCAWLGVSPGAFATEPAEGEQHLPLTHDDVVRRLRAAIDKSTGGDQKAWARAHDLSPQYVSNVLCGQRDAGQSILAALGLERVVIYREAEEGQS